MKRILIISAVAVLLAAAVVAIAQGLRFRGILIGYEEVPAVSTTGRGDFRAEASRDGSAVNWQLSYSNLEGNVTQAHIHFGQRGVNGGISVFLCSNLGNGPAGTQPCPAPPATISGTFTAGDVIGPAAQGIAPGEYAELLRAMRSGVTYANVHSSLWPGGEVRSQIFMPTADGSPPDGSPTIAKPETGDGSAHAGH